MNNGTNFDRFSVGKSDSQDEIVKVFAICFGCGTEIFNGYEYIDVDNDCVHNDYICLVKFIGGIRRIAGE